MPKETLKLYVKKTTYSLIDCNPLKLTVYFEGICGGVGVSGHLLVLGERNVATPGGH